MNLAFKTLQLKAKRQVYTLLSGNNLSHLYGEGYDFSELREYQVGDDIRKINWMISAKLGKPYIKELHANRELSAVICTLMDGSLYFGTGNKKQKRLTEVSMILSYAIQQNGDLFTGLGYTQNHTISTPPTKQLYYIDNFLQKLHELPLLHTTLNVHASIQDLFKRVHKPSLIFIIGDFLEEIDLSLLAQKHEVIAIIIRENEEESPKTLGEVIFNNPQNHTKKETYFGKRNIEKYLSSLKRHDDALIEHFSHHNIRYIKIFTEDNVIEKLTNLFL